MPVATVKQGTEYSDLEKAQAGLATFFSFASEWGLNNDQQMTLLGEPGRTTFYKWKRGDIGSVSRDTLDRLSYLTGIYLGLNILFRQDAACEWLRNPNTNPLFNRVSPLDYMLRGHLTNLADVRRYIDWARG